MGEAINLEIILKIKKCIKNNGIIVGCSAGTVIFGKDTDIISEMDSNDVNLIDTSGFDIMNGISIFPHYINNKTELTNEQNKIRIEKFTKSIIEFSLKKGIVYAIPEEDTIYINDNIIEIIGNNTYYVVSNGKMEAYTPNEEKNKKSAIKCFFYYE